VVALLAHAVHLGLLVAGLVVVAAAVWAVQRGRAERAADPRHDRQHDLQHEAEHDSRVAALRRAARDGTLGTPASGRAGPAADEGALPPTV
jgi:hypothetical protein